MIEINDITFRYPGTWRNVYEGFSLALPESKVYGLLGKNGTGKSTLLYLISGLLRPSAGSVRVDGNEASRRLPDMLREVFIVPEEFALPRTTLDEYVMLNSRFYPRFSKDVLVRCLHDFELPLSLRLDSLSMGQKKKVYMAFALAANTRLLLMDEPTNGLDIPSKSQFRKVVASNMTDDRTIIISTHQVHDVEQLLDHILIVGDNRMMLNASTADIAERYVFGTRRQGDDLSDAIYSEYGVMGNAVVAPRGDRDETPLNLELLFNAAVSGCLATERQAEDAGRRGIGGEPRADVSAPHAESDK